MIPVFDKKKAVRAGRPEDGPASAARRRIGVMHKCLAAALEGWNALTDKVKIIQWADGLCGAGRAFSWQPSFQTSQRPYLIHFFSRFVTFFSRFYVRSLEYSYVFCDPNIHFRSEVRSYPKNDPTVFFKIGVSEV
jgi:hypothetical protein